MGDRADVPSHASGVSRMNILGSRKTLVIAAHPDDEALGCGGTMARLVNEGALVHVAFLADGVGARYTEGIFSGEEIEVRRAAARTACKILGAGIPQFDDFP